MWKQKEVTTMRCTARREMEYLAAKQGRNSDDAGLIRELGRRLETLRYYDQYFCDADWHPQTDAACYGSPANDLHS
jgi:hypothetical protein